MKNSIRIAGLYVVVGVLWIFFSDLLLNYLNWNSVFIEHGQTIKGLLYVLITAILLFFMIFKLTKLHEKEIVTRVEAESQALTSLEENKRFVQLFDQVSSGLIITDPEQKGNPIIYANEGFVELTGYKKDEVIGRNCRFLQGNHTSKEDRALIQQAIENNKATQIEILNYKKNGEMFWNELKITPITSHNKLYFIGIQNDITEKKKQAIFIENQFNIVKLLLTIKDRKVAFQKICKLIEKDMDYQCLIFQKDSETKKLVAYATYSLSDEFISELKDFPIQPDEGISGSAAFYKKTMVENDISKMQNPKYVKIAERYHIKTIWSSPIITSNDEVIGAFTLYQDTIHKPSSRERKALETYAYIIGLVMENMNYQEKIKINNYRYQLIAQNSTDIICLINDDRSINYLSPSVKQLVGDYYDTQTLTKIFTPKSIHEITQFINYLLHVNKEDSTEIEVMNHLNDRRWLDVKGRRVVDESGKVRILFIARDITSRKQYQESLDKILYFDPVTQLPNKYKFRKVLEDTIQKQESFHLLIIDFYQMKEIKGMYGTKAWDHVIMKTPSMLEEQFQPFLLSRSGEDEFSIITRDTGENIKQDIDTFLSCLKKPWSFEHQEIIITMCIGVVRYQKQTADTMILQAQEALQLTRNSDGKAYHFYQQHNIDQQNRLFNIKRYLFQAIDQNEIDVHYQPQVDIKHKKVAGFEALIRWRNKELGNVSPGEFIGVAEETGWIVPISEYFMRQVFTEVANWKKEGLEYRVSVNISYKQMKEADFVEKVAKLLHETGCPAVQISFEITESLLLEDIELSINALQSISALGIDIEVDDFGVGYSSLSYLNKFPIDVLKIDRSFVQDLDRDQKNIAIVQAIMEMSHALGLQVIAEGVEELEQIMLLEDLGCEIFQGYWFSKPVSKAELPFVITEIYDRKFHEISS
ncbi:EAL domain-containing protein [Gracilibacillus massiliensis]|uniref:EAL domain-containing protein n=1 Tax=Gracilibacillus massiliensis TaxID=1564956 RepID=UPI00071E5BE1|nr:EAL domain-containing protein [Gracilibacillus massiliensis]